MLLHKEKKSQLLLIDLLPTQFCNASKPWVKEMNLFQRDKNILLSKNEWLSDDVINAAQHLLKEINPVLSGFQNTACGLVLDFSCETREFVQILYGENHWSVISSIGVPHGTVQIFHSIHTRLSASIKMQIANAVCTSNPGSADCEFFRLH